MENNTRLEKSYTLDTENFRKGYEFFQKKNILPKSYIFMGLYLILVVIYFIAITQRPGTTVLYILLFLCLALACREWYNPRKLKRSLIETFREMGDMTYSVVITDKDITFSTTEDTDVENSEDEEDYTPAEPSVIPLGDSLSLGENDEYILLYVGKTTFYIIPKNQWSGSELDILRSAVPLRKK